MSVHMGKWAVFILSRFCPTMFLCIANLYMSQAWNDSDVRFLLYFVVEKVRLQPNSTLILLSYWNRVLILRCWKSSTNLEIFLKIQLAKETRKNKTGRLRMKDWYPVFPQTRWRDLRDWLWTHGLEEVDYEPRGGGGGTFWGGMCRWAPKI